MHIEKELDLVGMVKPLCFLYLKKALKGLGQGELLQVRVEEPAIVRSMEMIIERSTDHLMDSHSEGDTHLILIRKG